MCSGGEDNSNKDRANRPINKKADWRDSKSQFLDNYLDLHQIETEIKSEGHLGFLPDGKMGVRSTLCLGIKSGGHMEYMAPLLTTELSMAEISGAAWCSRAIGPD